MERVKTGERVVTGLDDWNNEEWTFRAKQLIQWITTIDMNSPLMLLIRHSHRETLRNHEDMLSGALTSLGKSMSREMGRRIPTVRKAHFFFSIVPRCYETAVAMAEGFTEVGGEIIDMDPLPTLVRPEYTDDAVWRNLKPNGENVTEFVNRWAAREFEGQIESFSQFQNRLMDDTLRRLISLKENEAHIHVTHDLALMCAKRFLLDRSLTEEDREPYLGGIAIAYIDSRLQLFAGNEIIPVRLTLM
jgi:broad specificity phosphatase PhoE